MCNLYSLTKGPQGDPGFCASNAKRRRQHASTSGRLSRLLAPIVRDGAEGRALVMARWGMPSPVFALKGRNSDPGVTNIRNVSSPHWRRWLGVERGVQAKSSCTRFRLLSG